MKIVAQNGVIGNSLRPTASFGPVIGTSSSEVVGCNPASVPTMFECGQGSTGIVSAPAMVPFNVGSNSAVCASVLVAGDQGVEMLSLGTGQVVATLPNVTGHRKLCLDSLQLNSYLASFGPSLTIRKVDADTKAYTGSPVLVGSVPGDVVKMINVGPNRLAIIVSGAEGEVLVATNVP